MKTLKRLTVLATLALVLYAVGCKKEQTSSNENQSAQSAKGDHHHGAGPHGGVIADWGGGKYHVEFTVDHDKKQATVYILGSDAKTPAPIAASQLVLNINEPEFDVELKPEPLGKESGGVSSRFVGQHENLEMEREFAGTISGEVDGTPYAGDFEEEPHVDE